MSSKLTTGAPSAIVSGDDGVAPGDVTLQLAYDGGSSIALADGQSVQMSATGAAGAPEYICRIVSDEPGVHCLLLQQGGLFGDGVALRIINSSSPEPMIDVVSVNAGLDQVIARCTDQGSGDASYLSGRVLEFGSPGGNRAQVQSGTASTGETASVMCLRGGAGDTPDLAGPVSIGHAIDAANEGGGFYLDPATSGTQMRLWDNGDAEIGWLGLPVVSEAAEAAGLGATDFGNDSIWARDEVASSGDVRQHGLRALTPSSATPALLARGWQRTFVDGDLTAGVLTATHGLGTNAPLVAIYDDAGNLVPLASAPLFPSVAESSADELAVAITATNITGTWRITVIGF